MVKNYIAHDAVQKIPPIRVGKKQNVPKELISSSHSHEALQMM